MKAEWMRKQMEVHTTLGNKLTAIARRIGANAKHSHDPGKKEENQQLNHKAMKAYEELCSKMAKMKDDPEAIKKGITRQWNRHKNKKKNKKPQEDNALAETIIEEFAERIQKYAHEYHEMKETIKECDVTNPIHAAKITRMGNWHKDKAGNLRRQLKE